MPGLDHLHRHPPLDRLGLLGHPDGAHAAFADLLQQLVRADDRPGARARSGRDGEQSRRSRGARAVSAGSCPARSSWARSRASTCARRRRRPRRPGPGTRPAPPASAARGRLRNRSSARSSRHRALLACRSYSLVLRPSARNPLRDSPAESHVAAQDRFVARAARGTARPGRKPSRGRRSRRDAEGRGRLLDVRPAKKRSLTSSAAAGSSPPSARAPRPGRAGRGRGIGGEVRPVELDARGRRRLLAACGGLSRRGCGAWPRRRRRRSGRGRPGASSAPTRRR